MNRAALACFASLLFCSPGCGGIPARVPLEGKRLLVVPFSEGRARPFESIRGRELAQAVSAAVLRSLPRKAVVLNPQDLERLLPVSRGTEDWTALGAALKADFLLLGDIREYRLRDPGALTTRRGTLVVDYRVVDLTSKADVVLVPERVFHYPTTTEFGTDSFTSPEEIAKGLMAAAALGISEEFYEREKPE